MTEPVSWPDIRQGITDAVVAALGVNADGWKVTKYIPLTPDDPSIWVGWPSSMERSSMKGHYDYEVPVSFCVGMGDTDLAQEMLDQIYDDALYRGLRTLLAGAGLENAVPSPPADPPRRIEINGGPPGGWVMLAVDIVIELPST